MKKFDRKFGSEFIGSLPVTPGVYRVYDSLDQLIYVGKAKNLRRRLSQYRNAKRRKKHLKMRTVVEHADRIEYETCSSDLDACLLEMKLIQVHRPRWNVAGAYYFLYPQIGLKELGGNMYFAFTTEPQELKDFRFHGSYRSRHLTGDGFFSLMKLLEYVGHRVPNKQLVKSGIRPASTREKKSRSYVFGFRQLDVAWVAKLEEFFMGKSNEALQELTLRLLDHSSALRDREKVQEYLNDLKRFWRHESRRLMSAIKKTGYQEYPVPQRERDFLFLRHSFKGTYDHAEKNETSGSKIDHRDHRVMPELVTGS